MASRKRMGAFTQQQRAPGSGQERSTRPAGREHFLNYLESLFRGEGTSEQISAGSWSPRVDIRETDENYLLQAELPGLSKEDIEITLRDDVLKLSGERRLKTDIPEEEYHLIERSYGAFTRAFSLPGGGDSSQVEAALENGILTVRVPKAVEGSLQKVYISDELTAAEAKVLSTGGFDLTPSESKQDDPIDKTISDYSELVASSLTTKQAAQHLGVADSRVRQRLGEGTLYGLQRQRKWLLPAFQFTTDGELPHLSEVLPALSRDIHPVALQRWFDLPNPDLTDPITDQHLSVRDWLRAGNPPDAVIRMASYL